MFPTKQQTEFSVFFINSRCFFDHIQASRYGFSYIFYIPSMSLHKNDTEQESARDAPDYKVEGQFPCK